MDLPGDKVRLFRKKAGACGGTNDGCRITMKERAVFVTARRIELGYSSIVPLLVAGEVHAIVPLATELGLHSAQRLKDGCRLKAALTSLHRQTTSSTLASL